MLKIMPWLSQAKHLRGTPLDVFGYQAERKLERQLRDQFLADLTYLSQHLHTEQFELALRYVQIPQTIRGFGPVKHQAIERARREQQHLLQQGLTLS